MNALEQYLVKAGKDLIWQNPSKDRQSIIEMAKISPRNGYRKYGKVGFETIETPLIEGNFHFYQLGDNWPGDFGLVFNKYQWMRLSVWCRYVYMTLRIYTKTGKLFPVTDAYVIRLYNDNLIIAIKDNQVIDDLNTEKLYIHFYRNHYYRYDIINNQKASQLLYDGGMKNAKNDLMGHYGQYLYFKSKETGGSYLTVNGYFKLDANVQALAQGDIIESHYDSSIKHTVDIKLSELRTYKSTLDEKNKYLVHIPKKYNNGVINYRDDIDFFVYKKDKGTGDTKGLYYHRNMEDSARMVTHNDYALPVPYVMYYVENIDPNADLDDFYLRVLIRDNGQETKIISDVNMIKSLYVLDDEKIIEALTKVDGNLPEWRADHLESSAYTGLMRSNLREITPNLVLDSFGYLETAKQLAYPNHIVREEGGQLFFSIPIGLRKDATVFEYNANGLLLGWYQHVGLDRHYPYNADCVFIEIYSGQASDEITMHVGNTPFKLKEETSYRFYLAKTAQGKRVSDFVDVTNDPRILVDGIDCQFNHDNYGEIGVVIGDDKFLCYKQILDINDGVLDFAIASGMDHTKKLLVPPGKIDLWLNGHALVEGIDYYVDFPNVSIVTKSYLQEGFKQEVTVRCMGFPFMENGALKRISVKEAGFVQYGKISVNHHYDIHEDRVLRTTVNGGVFDPSVIPFDEDGNTNVGRFVEDGKPYSVETHYIALKGLIGLNLYHAQMKDFDLTLRVQNYITQHANVEDEHDKQPILENGKYHVYSPFLSRIISDLKYNRLKSLPPSATLEQIDTVIRQKYIHLINLDPTIRGYDSRFVNVHAHIFPHYIELSPRDIAFLERINEIYLKKIVDISNFVTVRKTTQ